MLRLNSEIMIGDLIFTTVVNVEIESSWNKFTDTARISFPSNLKNENLSIIDSISIGDAVSIKLGYYPYLDERFSGFVSKIDPNNPIVIHCEDLMWQLKQTSVKEYSNSAASLSDLLTTICPIDFETSLEVQLGKFRISDANVVEVLETLKKKYGLVSFIRNGKLNVGFSSNYSGEKVTFVFNGNSANIISDSLNYYKADSLDIVVRGTSFKTDNSKIERYAYYENGKVVVSSIEKEGALRTLNFVNLSETELDKVIKEKLPEFIYEGYRGSFTSFLMPFVEHGDLAELQDLKFPEKNGTYKIKSVNTTFGADGARQEIELDIKVSE
jgi:hypothetical protein